MRLMLVNGVNGPWVGGLSFLVGRRRLQASLVKVFQIKMGPGKIGVSGAKGPEEAEVGH